MNQARCCHLSASPIRARARARTANREPRTANREPRTANREQWTV